MGRYFTDKIRRKKCINKSTGINDLGDSVIKLFG